MKKIGILLMICFLMGGCSQKATPAEMYKMVSDGQTATSQAEGMNATIDMGIKMTIGEETQDMKITGVLLIDNSVAEDLKFKMEMNMDMDGQTMAIVQYYKEGYLYMDMLGMKLKQAMPMDLALNQAESMNVMNDGFGEEMYNNAKLSKSVDDTVITAEIDGNLMKDQTAKMLEQFNMGDMAGVEMEYGTVSMESVLNKDGALVGQAMVLPMKVTAQGEVMEMTMDISMKYANVGQPVVVEFPDFSEYIEQ